MDKDKIVNAIATQMRTKFDHEPTGHDWWHLYRVRQIAEHLNETEQGNLFIIKLAALLHDIADWKFHAGDEAIGPETARQIMNAYDIDTDTIDHVCEIVATISFKGASVATPMRTIEGKIVQDADRIDALGAIGIARTFAYGGHLNRQIHNPEKSPTLHQDKESYKNGQGTSVNHFYEKLFLLKDRMNTVSGKKIATERHIFLQSYLEKFLAEWDGQQ